MAREKIHRFCCRDCPDCFIYGESVPQKVPGAFLKFGGKYCRGGKKMREFKHRDPKVYPPSWCPKLKSPAEFRVYAYKDTDAWFTHHLMRVNGLSDSPCGYEFAVRVEGHTDLSARDFWEEVESKSVSEILCVPVHVDEVIEIDDGLRPCFFHVTEDWDVKVLAFFQRDKARENHYEERITS